MALTGQLLSEFEAKYSPRPVTVLRFTWWNFPAPGAAAEPKSGGARLIGMVKLAYSRTCAHNVGPVHLGE